MDLDVDVMGFPVEVSFDRVLEKVLGNKNWRDICVYNMWSSVINRIGTANSLEFMIQRESEIYGGWDC